MRRSNQNKNSFECFKQRILRVWQLVSPLQFKTIIFIILGVAFLGIGIALTIHMLSNHIIEYKEQYDVICTGKYSCPITITITESMPAPIFFSYELENFYQNHRRYQKSRDNDQLAGIIKSVTELDQCDPVILNKDIRENLPSYDNSVILRPDDPANPCGLVARSFFNDEYTLTNLQTLSLVTINENGIASADEINHKFKQPLNARTIQWIDVTNEHFIVWMRTVPSPNFRKLWGRIEQDLSPGEYQITVTNKYDVSSFGGAKYVVISTENPFPDKNYFLAATYLGFGSVIALLFLIKYKRSR